MFKLNDRIKEKTYSVGSGNLDFSGATPAYSSFSSVYNSGDNFFYCITNDIDYEIGIGRYSPNRLERVQIFKSSKPSNAIVNWPVGLKEVYVTYPSENSVYQINNIDSQNAPSAKNFAYWYGANSVSDIEGLSFDSGRVVSSLEFSFSNVIRFSGFALTQNSPFRKDELITSTLIDEVIYQSGEVNQHKGFKKQRSGTVLAGPLDNCGSGTCPSGYPIFRPLSEEDIPVIDAENVSYTPANSGNWISIPTNVETALDLLAIGSSSASSVNWNNVTNKPSTFTPTLPIPSSGVTGFISLGETSSNSYRGDRGKIAYDHSQTSGNPHNLVKSDIALGNVDNTSDLNKPISTLTQTALNGKSNTGHTHVFSDITDNIPISKFNAASGASSTTFWRGDGTWATVATGSANWGSINGTLTDQSDLVSALAGKANSSHTHVTTDITNLSSYTGLDVRYYTETEVNSLLSSHTHIIASVTGLQAALDAKANLVHTHALSDLNQSSATSGQVATWNGSAWIASSPITGVTDHSLLSNLSADDHTQYFNIARGDARYNTKSEITSFLAGKAAFSHAHNASDISAGTLSYSRLPVGSVANTICAGDDSRLSNSRNPLSHTHAWSEISGNIPISKFNTGTGATSTAVWVGNGTWIEAGTLFNSNLNNLPMSLNLGKLNAASGTQNIAVGFSNTVNGSLSLAVGYGCVAENTESHSGGSGSPPSISIGYGINNTRGGVIELGVVNPTISRTSIRIAHGTLNGGNSSNPFFMLPVLVSSSALADGGAIWGFEASNTIPREMMTFRRNGNNIYIDINIGGTVKSLLLGTAT